VIAFYSGEHMSPESIRASDASARFRGRASVVLNPGEAPDLFADVLADKIWGILIETNATGEGTEVEVTDETGQILEALLAEPMLGGDAAKVLANARYWELPPEYVARLRSIVEAGLDDN
jgi:hypothetical protein